MFAIVHSDQERYDFERKKASGIGYFDTNGGYTDTGIPVRQSLQNMGIEYVKVGNPFFFKNNIERSFSYSFYICTTNVTQKRRFFYSNLKDYVHALPNFNIIIPGDFNYVENDEDRMTQLNKGDKLVKRTFKPSTFNSVDTFRKFHKNKIKYTHKTARIDGIYVTKGLSAQISSCKHLSNMADHKAICLDINIEEFKPLGSFYWKLDSSILNENGYIKPIEELFKEFELRRENVDILENWKIFKNEVKEVSKRYSNAKAKERRT